MEINWGKNKKKREKNKKNIRNFCKLQNYFLKLVTVSRQIFSEPLLENPTLQMKSRSLMNKNEWKFVIICNFFFQNWQLTS